jgi:hypothetical protein
MISPFMPVINVDLGESFHAFQKDVSNLLGARESKRAAAGTYPGEDRL